MLKWAISPLQWDTKLLAKYWTLKRSPISWPCIYDFHYHDQSLVSLVVLIVFASSLCIFCCCFIFVSVFTSSLGLVKLWWPVEHWCSRTSFERQGKATLERVVQEDQWDKKYPIYIYIFIFLLDVTETHEHWLHWLHMDIDNIWEELLHRVLVLFFLYNKCNTKPH